MKCRCCIIFPDDTCKKYKNTNSSLAFSVNVSKKITTQKDNYSQDTTFFFTFLYLLSQFFVQI